MSNKLTVNGKEYSNALQFCKDAGLSYNNFKQHKKRKGNEFEMKLVKVFKIKVK